MKKLHYFLLIVLLVLALFVNNFYGIPKYPIHPDEYAHIAQAKDIVDTGSIRFVNPYFKTHPFHLRLEPGFHIFLASFILIFKDSFIPFFHILRDFIFLLNTFLLFIFVYRLSKNYFIGLFSAIFFIFLKSTIEVLGNLFLLPVNLGITFTLVFFILLLSYYPMKKWSYYLLLAVFLISLLVYPPSAVLIFLILFFASIKSITSINKEFLRLIIPISILFILLAIILFSFTKTLLSYIVFTDEWTPVAASYSPVSFYGLLAFALAIIGILVVFRKFNSYKFLVYWFLICLFDVYLFYVFKFTLFIPFTRVFYFYLLSLCILSAFGLYHLVYFISKLRFLRKFSIPISIFLVLLVIAFQFLSFYSSSKNFFSQGVLDDAKYDALMFIKDNYGTHNVVMSDPITSFAIYPLTDNYVVALLESNIGVGARISQKNFFIGSCEDKQSIANKFNVSLVASNYQFSCKFMDKVYSKNGFIVYDLAD